MIAALTKELEDTDRTAVVAADLSKFDSEDEFNSLSVDLMVEVGCLLCIAVNILPTSETGWNRDQAIVGGLGVRLFKLIDAMLDQTCKHRRETAFIFARLIYETIVNLIVLAKTSDPDLFASYVAYSMKHEKKLLDRINKNIAKRSGSALPIERRMIDSIMRKAAASGFDIHSASPSSPKNWGDMTLYEKSERIGFGDVYLGAFSGPSHNVHGNWMDILEYHLEVKDGGFYPRIEWARPKPQVLLALAKLTIDAIREFMNFIGHLAARVLFEARLRDLWDRILLVDTAHEEYLTLRQKS